jgi:DNA polymerase III delta prime subunit
VRNECSRTVLYKYHNDCFVRMGRFRVPAEDEYREEENHFQAQHFYSSDDDEKEEPGGHWRGAIVPLSSHCPQNNDDDKPVLHHRQSEETFWGGSSIQPPNVAISSRSSPNRETISNTNHEHGLQPHYYEYQQPPPPPPRTSPLWLRIFWVALLAHLVARYGPVAPPPGDAATRDDSSWEDFWVQEIRQLWRSVKLIGYTTPKYVAEWVVVGLYDDAHSWYHRYQHYQQERVRLEYWRHCVLEIPDQWNLEEASLPFFHDESNDENHRRTASRDYQLPIVGQPLAVQATTQAIDAWTQTSPLLLYFAGDRGVGKLELARQVSQRIFGHCCTNENKTIDELFQASGPIMMLQGRDFALHQDDDEIMAPGDAGEFTKNNHNGGSSSSSISILSARTTRAIRVQLYESIIRQAESHPNGTVVILQQVEDLADGLLAAIVQALTNPSRYAASPEEQVGYRDGTATDAHQSLASRLQEACSKVLFIMTSTVGSKTIAHSRQRYHGGAATVQARELDLALMHEIDMKFATSTTSNANNPKQRSTKRIDVGSVSLSRPSNNGLSMIANLKIPTFSPFFIEISCPGAILPLGTNFSYTNIGPKNISLE